MPLMEAVVPEAVLDQGYAWLCQRRRAFPTHADVWALRRHWQRERPRLRAELLAGTYRCAVRLCIEAYRSPRGQGTVPWAPWTDAWPEAHALTLPEVGIQCKLCGVQLPKYPDFILLPLCSWHLYPGRAGLQPGSRRHAGAWRSQQRR